MNDIEKQNKIDVLKQEVKRLTEEVEDAKDKFLKKNRNRKS